MIAAAALGGMGPEAKTAVPVLAELLKDKDSYVRLAAASALWQIGPKAETDILVLAELLKDKESYIRLAAALALWSIGPKAETNAELLMGKDDVCESAVMALGDIGPEAKAAVPALTVLLGDRSEYIRNAAAEALENINQEKK